MASKLFYFVDDDPETAKTVPVDFGRKLDDLKRAVALQLHTAVPQGLSFHASEADHNNLTTLKDVFSVPGPVPVRVSGFAVRNPQGPEGLPLVGSFYQVNYLTNDPDVALVALGESQYFTKKINEDRPLFGIKDNTAIFIGDTENENWRLAHKFLPPTLGPKAVRHYTPDMQQCVRSSFKVFDELDSRGESWNVYQYMVKLASQTVGKFAFAKDMGQFDSVDTPVNPLVTNIVNMLALSKKVTARGEWYRNLPFGDSAKLKQVQRDVYHMISETIESAPSSGIENMPLNEAATRASCVADYLVNAVDKTDAHFPMPLVLSNMLVVTGAGYTTTSSLMSWLIYTIVTYPGVQDKLLQELVDYNISEKTEWTPDHAHGLPYLDKFVKETQRLHNASFQPGRTTKTDVVVPGGYRILENSVMIPALYAIHTSSDHWHDPYRFDPERWDTDEVKKERHRGSYLPFATGPRGCIGFNFAEGTEAIQYDPEFQLIRPLNLYVTAKRRTTYPAKSANVPVNIPF
ncbi:cytochrome P450 monooxygenase [Cladorrhinum sp. PSN332]|nr:cytochrome P450 monooxygenase [Cladorrhinum sp. PSN332]